MEEMDGSLWLWPQAYPEEIPPARQQSLMLYLSSALVLNLEGRIPSGFRNLVYTHLW